MSQARATNQIFIAAASFTVLFSIVGLALYGLPFYYDYMVSDFGWSRTQVTSGNALSKLVVGLFFGFFAGWIVDRFDPRRNTDGGTRPDRPRSNVGTLDVLRLLPDQCSWLCLRRTAAEPNSVVPV